MIFLNISRPFRTGPALLLPIHFSSIRRSGAPFIAVAKKSFQKISKKPASCRLQKKITPHAKILLDGKVGNLV